MPMLRGTYTYIYNHRNGGTISFDTKVDVDWRPIPSTECFACQNAVNPATYIGEKKNAGG